MSFVAVGIIVEEGRRPVVAATFLCPSFRELRFRLGHRKSRPRMQLNIKPRSTVVPTDSSRPLNNDSRALRVPDGAANLAATAGLLNLSRALPLVEIWTGASHILVLVVGHAYNLSFLAQIIGKNGKK